MYIESYEKFYSSSRFKSDSMSIETGDVNQDVGSLTSCEMADLLIKDLEAQADLMIKENRRQHDAAAASITAMYKVNEDPCRPNMQFCSASQRGSFKQITTWNGNNYFSSDLL